MDMNHQFGLDARPRDRRNGLSYSPTVQRIAGEGARAWDVHYRAAELARGGRDAILLTVGDPDFDTPPAIQEACFDAIRKGRTHPTTASTGGCRVSR